jgi:tetratricopeptide (TPR) repeat protein
MGLSWNETRSEVRQTMSAEELFNQAYNLSVVEEKHRDAIHLCRKALEIEPHNYRILVFLGMLLGDHGSESEIAEARGCFTTAIKNAKSASCFCTSWPEEAAIHHLGVWEWSQGNYLNASMFFLIDTFVCKNKESSRQLTQLLAENDLPLACDIELILKRIMTEYQIVSKPK